MLTDYLTYEEAARDYLVKFQAFRDTPPAPSEVIVRGAGEVDAQALVDRAEEIADISSSMVGLSKVYLDDPSASVREGMSGQLLSQVAAELQVATELLQIVESGETEKPDAVTLRTARGTSLRDAIAAMEKTMAEPVTAGLKPFIPIQRSAATGPKEIGQAKEKLKTAAITSAGAIRSHVSDAGGSIASRLVFETEWSSVIEGAGLMSKKAADLLDSVKEGLGAFFAKAVAVAAKTLLNVYDKILALLGKDIEGMARTKISEWLEKIKQEGRIEVFDYLVGSFYQVDNFKNDLTDWLGGTTAEVDKINTTTNDVAELAQKFIVLVGRINKISDISGLAKMLKFPQIHAVIAGIRIALLAALVYAGYDYIGYEQVRFPNLTKGVAELIRENLLPSA